MKKHILLVLKTLVINNACVEAARTKEKKYNIIAVVLGLIGLFLSVLPIGVTKFSVQGSAWMSSNGYNYALDKGLANFVNNLNDETGLYTKTTMEIKKNSSGGNYLYVNQESWDAKHPETAEKTLFRIYTYKTPDNVARAQFFIDVKSSDVTFEKKVSNLLTNRSCTLIAFGRNKVYAYLYAPGITGAKTSFGGDYHSTKPGTKFETFYTEGSNPSMAFNNFAKFFNESYILNRRAGAWKQIGIMLGVNGGVLIFMGAMVFILTRGKNNPFRIYSFWDGQKIAYYCSFTPSLLSLLGFAIPTLSLMLYALTLGIRVMWLSMRTLRYTAPVKK